MRKFFGYLLLSIPIAFVFISGAIVYGLLNFIIAMIIIALFVGCLYGAMRLLDF